MLKKQGGKFHKVNGKLATGCIWGLVKCSDGSDSGMRICAGSLSSSGTYKYTDGHCYTINTNPSPICGSMISASSLTAVTGCSDSSCSSLGTVCPTCPGTLPSSVTLGGFSGAIVNCGGSLPFSANDCYDRCFTGNGLLPTWNRILSGPACGPPGYAANPPTPVTIPLADGTCTQVVSAQLQCQGNSGGSGGTLTGYGGPASPGWGMQIAGGPTCSGDGENWTVWYYKVGTSTPIGTYTLGATLLGGCFGGTHATMPATVTIS